MVCIVYQRFCPLARLHHWLCRCGLAQSSACRMLNFMCKLCPEYWREWKIVNEVLRGVEGFREVKDENLKRKIFELMEKAKPIKLEKGKPIKIDDGLYVLWKDDKLVVYEEVGG